MLTKVSRRQFVSGLGALALGGGWAAPRIARAAASSTKLPYLFVDILAYGGWDTTMLCDPKMSPNAASPIIRAYNDPSQLTTVGAFTLPDPSKGAVASANTLAFFQKYYASTVAINGVDATTTQHDEGQLATTCGTTGATYPVLTSLVAAVYGADTGAPLMSSIGVNTQGLVGVTPLDASMANVLGSPMSGNVYGAVHSPAAWSAVQNAIQSRLARRQAAAILPTKVSRLRLYQAALSGAAHLDNLMAAATDITSSVPSDGGMGDIGSGLAFDIAVTLASYMQGQTVSAQYGSGGFDTHTDSDASQVVALDAHFAFMDYLFRAAQHANIQDQILLHMGSDFGRCPFYNGYNFGKDHWPTTTVLLMGSMLQGNRVIGASDAGVMAQPVDPVTLAVSDTGVNITHAHIHNDLRRFMNIDTSSQCNQFGLRTEVELKLIT